MSANKKHYFFIVSKSNGKVLDNCTRMKGGQIKVMEANGGPSQLWRWDESCRLVTKLTLVADIKDKKMKEGSKCIVWQTEDGPSQKWRVEEGIIKSNFGDLVMSIDAAPYTSQISMRRLMENNATQQWHFIPENAWDDFRLLQEDPNPLSQAQFWKNMADNYIDVIIGYDIDHYKAKVHRAVQVIHRCANILDRVTKDVGIAGVSGGSGAVIGGGMALVGLLLAPFSGGASLALTAAGAGLGAAGSVTTLVSSQVLDAHDKGEAKKVNGATGPIFRATLSLQGFLKEYLKVLEKAAEFLKTPEGKAFANDAYTFTEMAGAARKIAMKAYKVGNTVIKTARQVKQVKEITKLVEFIQADYYALSGARIGLATEAAAPGLSVPLLGKAIVSAGTTSAKVLSGSFAVVGVGVGIWDIVGGANKINNGSDLAKEFRKTSKDLEEESGKLIKLYEELTEN